LLELSQAVELLHEPPHLLQFDWVCDDAWKPAFTQSVFYMGAICGTIFFGWTSDHYGRYWTFIASNLVIMVTGIATPFAVDFVSFCVLRFLMGTGFITFFMVLYMLSMHRLFSGTIYTSTHATSRYTFFKNSTGIRLP
jgi:MFS family permease